MRLRTTHGRTLILRLVGCKDRFGPDRAKVHTSMRALGPMRVEITRVNHGAKARKVARSLSPEPQPGADPRAP